MKNRTSMHRPLNMPGLRRRMLPLLIAGCFGQAAHANPQGAQVVSGQVGFQQQGGVLAVTNSPGAIINWQSFSINAGETTRFLQQGPSSAVLNRVVGQDPSKILGALQSNGKVFLVNPNGILFGQGAQIDVNGLVASTLNIGNEDFLNGKLNFRSAGGAGSISNQGTIRTPDGGLVYLVAPNIENSGIIHSPRGDVMLAAGHTVQLVDSSNPSLQVVVSAPESEALNLGSIISEGGRTGIYGALIKQRGIVSADSAVVGENGRIVFRASRDTLLEAGSVTTAGGAGKGGEIQVLGERVGVMGNAKIDASGQAGGGSVLVGGDYKGGNPNVRNAMRTFVSRDASISADAGVNGDGGKVIVWGDETTRAHGRISARGGSLSGNGGFVETSGAYLDVADIQVDTRAGNGSTGSWLLDPANIYVTASGTAPLSEADAFDDNAFGNSHVAASTISGAASTVILQAKNDIEFNSAVNMTALHAGLIAEAGNDIKVNATIRTNGGAVDLRANSWPYPNGDGQVFINSSIQTNGGDVNLYGAGIAVASGASIDTGSGYIWIDSSGSVANSGSISADADIDILAGADFGNAGSIRAGNGYVWIDAAGTVTNTGSLGSEGDIDVHAGGNLIQRGSIAAEGGVYLRAGQDALLSVDQPVKAVDYVDLIADRLALNATVAADEVSIRPYTAGRSITVGQTECVIAGCLSITNLHRVAAKTIGIGRDPLDYGYDYPAYEPYSSYDYGYAGPIHVAGITDSGTGALTDRHSMTTLIGLLSGAGVTQSGAIKVRELGVIAGGDVALNHSGNQVSRVFGSALEGGFSFVNVGPLSIGAPADLDIDYDTMGIWTAGGGIKVSNTGHLTVDRNASVWSVDGGIDLVAHSPLTVDGTIFSNTGAISLEAAASGSASDILTINGAVMTSGRVRLKAGAGIVINGTVESPDLSQESGLNPQAGPIEPAFLPLVTATAAQATQTIIASAGNAANVIAASPEKEKVREESGASRGKEDGAKKNESAKKLYCN